MGYRTLRGVASLEAGTIAIVSKPTRSDDSNQSEYLFDGVITVTAAGAGAEGAAAATITTALPSISGTWKKKGSADIGLPENAGTFTVKQAAPSLQHNSGLWLGEAVPLDAFAHDTARNPITWALSSRSQELLEDAAAPAVFGCGFFDDSGDIPGMPVLFYTLQHEDEDEGIGAGAGDGDAAGSSAGGDAVGALADAATAAATSEGPSFVKLYEEPIPHRVQYAEVKQGLDGTGQATLAGSWTNVLEATMGVFAARLEPPSEGFQVAPPADADAADAAAAPLAAIGE